MKLNIDIYMLQNLQKQFDIFERRNTSNSVTDGEHFLPLVPHMWAPSRVMGFPRAAVFWKKAKPQNPKKSSPKFDRKKQQIFGEDHFFLTKNWQCSKVLVKLAPLAQTTIYAIEHEVENKLSF